MSSIAVQLIVLGLAVIVTSAVCSVLSYHLGWSERGRENNRLEQAEKDIRRLKKALQSDKHRIDEAHVRINTLSGENKFLHQQQRAMFGAMVRMPGVDVNRLKAELFGGAKSKN